MDTQVRKVLAVIQEFLDSAESQDIMVTRVILELWGNPVTQVYQEFLVTPELVESRAIVESLEYQDIRGSQVFRAILEFTEPLVTQESPELADTPVLKVFQDIRGLKGQVDTLVFLASQGSLVIRVWRE